MQKEFLIKLHQTLEERMNEGELRTLCFYLGVDYDNLPGAGKADKARELILYLDRRNRTAELVEIGYDRRPDIDWGTLQPHLWKKLGLEFTCGHDSTFVQGAGKSSTDVYHMVLDVVGHKNLPLDWNYPFQALYTNEPSVLWVTAPGGQRSFLPQVVVISPTKNWDENSIRVELEPADFQAPVPVRIGLEFYRRNMDGSVKKIFFDGENARLLDWVVDDRKLVFQGSSYFDYLQTNLSLDTPLPVVGSLRKQLAVNGRLESLQNSKLANATGINGLLFSNDGHLIIQKRGDNVLIRPGELCSGFSGTVDKIDIAHAVKEGGRLADLDTLREMAEELGIKYGEVAVRRFVGLTRELIRGGTPEMFYALDVNLSVDVILSRIPREKEGECKAVFFGPYASANLGTSEAANFPNHFWSLIEAIQAGGDGPVSIPLLTNLVLWYQSICPTQAGADAISRRNEI